MPKPCVLDVDTGVDDAHALLFALRSPSLDVLGVTCVSGNVGVDVVIGKARHRLVSLSMLTALSPAATMKVLDAAEAPLDLPVARGFDTPLIEPTLHCPQIHG
jgi:inosine-uridine nucleoside N-ribohydrolase